MKMVLAITVVLALLGLGIAVQADVFNMGAGFTNLETVTVGNPGNIGDTTLLSYDPHGQSEASYGSVGYVYNIGKYEVTAKQYTDFLNAKAQTDTFGLYHTSMWGDSRGCKIERTGDSGSYVYSVADDYANRPVNYVSWADSARFTNWLGNGQGTGDTETGAYTMANYNGSNDPTVQRNTGATCVMASENEWYKAAYYDPNKGGSGIGGYWDYPTKSDAAPANQVLGTDPGNSANYWVTGFSIGSPYYRTNVGEFENSGSAYGTFDQGGNVWEWNDRIVYTDGTHTFRGLRGGSFDFSASSLVAQNNYSSLYSPTVEYRYIGFRVAQVPEPSSLIALGALVAPLLAFRRRSRK